MRKLTLLLFIISANFALAQNITFEQVGIKVQPEKASYVLDLLDDFYGNIEKPENVSISLNRIYFKPEGTEATHYLTFAGSVEGLASLRKIRGGDKYSIFNSNILKFAEIVSVSGGSTLLRNNLEKSSENTFQVWKWRVEDAPSFASAFTDLIKAFPQQGYLSLGQFTHGISSDGESHYVYITHKDYAAALNWGPKTASQQEAFIKFQKITNKFSNFLGSMTLYKMKSW
ncbi:hypothetical protein N9D15_04380 [Flavobacteriaceae bacterium]|jgi:hypothetical protein|nr:hypothetical protein [Flavobacteriaceae bacterium]